MPAHRLPPWLAAALGGLLGVFVVALLVRLFSSAHPPTRPAQEVPATPEVPFEAFEEKPPPVVPAPAALHPRRGLALIIDDLGYNRQALAKVFALPGPIAIAVLPEAPWAKEAVQKAKARGWSVLLHLPLEPKSERYRLRMTPAFLRVAMPSEEIERRVAAMLDAFPQVVGVNNHMGSRFTEDRRAMRALLEVLARRDLFFVDSLTSPRSVGIELARKLGLRWARRDLFLDHDPSPQAIARQWHRALDCAKTRICIVIAHPYPSTLAWLDAHLRQHRSLLLPAQAALHDPAQEQRR